MGSAPHFGAAYFSQATGAKMTHVPFKGGSPAVVSVVSGDTQLTFATPPSVLGMVKGGRLRALAVTSRERSPLMPDIPGTAEAGIPDYAISFWYGLFVPAGTPPDIVMKLHEATIAAFLAEDSKFWVSLAKKSGATAA